MIPLFCGSGSGAGISSKRARIRITWIRIQGRSESMPRSGSNSGSGSTSNEKLGPIKLIFLKMSLISQKFVNCLTLLVDPDPNPEVDPDLMWIQIFQSLDPELESESQNGPKSGSGSGSKAGFVTPLEFIIIWHVAINQGRGSRGGRGGLVRKWDAETICHAYRIRHVIVRAR